MKHLLPLAVATATLGLVGASPAMADGPTLCIGGGAVVAPNGHGQCPGGKDAVTLATQDQVASLQQRVSSLEDANTALKARVATLETKLTGVSYDPTGVNGKPTTRFSGVNVQVVSGSGQTDGWNGASYSTNGLGNLIIGYDENPNGYAQDGSHNLIVGKNQGFSSFGSLVAGLGNRSRSPWQFAAGGFNLLNGEYGSVLGGFSNQANGLASAVLTGTQNQANGTNSAVLAGAFNTADGPGDLVAGGSRNSANSSLAGPDASSAAVLGGNDNHANGAVSAVVAGHTNTTTGVYSSILGGLGNTVTGACETFPATFQTC